MAEIEPPSYSYEELLKKKMVANQGSLNRESAEYLLKRGSKPSALYPDRYYFSGDTRLKFLGRFRETPETQRIIAKRIRCPYLFFRARGDRDRINMQNLEQVLGIIQQKNPYFEWHYVQGGHHVHLLEPEKFCDRICGFIERYRPADDGAKCKL